MSRAKSSDPLASPWSIDPGPHTRYVDAYQRHLLDLGHRDWTVSGKVLPARHFCRWLDLTDRCLSDVRDTDVDRFADHECRCKGARRRRPIHSRYLSKVRSFVRFLVEAGVVEAPSAPTPQRGPEIAAWLDWLRRHKGLSVHTLENHEFYLRKLLPLIGTDPRRYDPLQLRTAFLERCLREGRDAWPRMATALRSWLAYNCATGRCPATLTTVLPPIVRRRRDNVPRGLKAPDVERLLAACDTATATGRRDLAVLLLLARLGLRAGDVQSLTFDQIDWKRGCLRVSGKSRREAKLPLPQEVGDAILAYLEDGRPPLDDPHVFLSARAPVRPFATSRVASKLVARAIRRARLKNTPSRGANLLRHSLASGLIEDGATLETVAGLLRHRSIETTSIYAKADPGRLGEIAQAWPGGAS